MSQTVIRVDDVWKQYKIGVTRARHNTLRDAIVDGFTGAFKRGSKDESVAKFWALQGVTFDVRDGDVVGVVGRNGAGKSTLLKILSRITEPTKGSIQIKGRVGSLLEVGTGFHPELSGRENVFLNGAILGMRKTEISKKFDEIVAFAEVEKFIDTPVKRYSSGMYVRLAFAVAAHLEPEILIVDEVLAVGDAAFQKKCLGKMGDVAKEGRTVLFVSHNMAAVVSLCNRAVLLERGAVVQDGLPSEIAAQYQTSFYHTVEDTSDLSGAQHMGTGKARFTSAKIVPVATDGEPRPFLRPGDDMVVDLKLECYEKVEESNVAITIYDATGYRLIDANTALQGEFVSMVPGESAQVRFSLRNLLLKPGTYLLGLWLGRGALEMIDGITYATSFTVEPDPELLMHSETFPGIYQCRFDQSIEVGDRVEVER